MSKTETKINHPVDFPDHLPPMLVKELRQGMRTNLFVTAFILLQAFMILCILMGASEGGSNQAANGFFWFFVFVIFILVQPLRAVGALSSEFQVNTMDLIQLTRLTSWRITWGKWCAINAQTLLLAVSVLPYLVLRYFFGQVDVIRDLGILGLYLGASALLSAAAVGCSAFRPVLVRIMLILGVVSGFSILQSFVYAQIARFGGALINEATLWMIGLAGLFGLFFFLLAGASRIASGSENHATTTRLLGVFFAIAVWSFHWFGANLEACNVVSGIILGLTAIAAMTEPPPIFGSILRPFSSHFLTRGSAWFLTPGWHTAVLFFVFPCLTLWLGLLYFYFGMKTDIDSVGLAVSSAAMVSFPLIPIHLFFRRSTEGHALFPVYLFIQVCLLMLTVLVVMVAESSSQKEFLSFVPLPSVIFFGFLDSKTSGPVFAIIALFWLFLSLVIPLVRALPLFGEMRKVFSQIRAEKKSLSARGILPDSTGYSGPRYPVE